LISLETFDRSVSEIRIVGYSVIHLFIDRMSMKPADEKTDRNVNFFNSFIL